jgi:predicted kinase
MLSKILYGRKKSLTLPNGEKRMAQYAIVELDEIMASHNEINFQDTEGYPRNEFGRNINDRNYKDDPAAQQTVISIAQNLDADKLIELTSSPSGTPIIDKNGFVVSGNNRVMSLKLAAKKYIPQYENYYYNLVSELETFGFDKTGFAQYHFKNPVLVRIDEDIPVLNTTELSKYNLNAKKGERPVDKAVKLANILRENERCRNVILNVIDGYETFSDLYGPQGRNDRKKLVGAFIDCGLIPEQQMVSFYSEGEFTDAGKDFLESVLSAMILTPDALNVAGLEGIKRLRQIIISSLPVLITNQNLGEASLQPYISEAVVLEHKIRQVGDFSTYIRSQNLFGDENFNEKSFVLNRLLNEGRNTFKDAIKKYNESVKANTGPSMFAGEQLTPQQIFDAVIFRAIPENDQHLIFTKFSKPQKMAEVATVETLDMTSTDSDTEKNLWINDNWFAENPDKILGAAYQASGRFGTVTKYKGTIDDLNKIEAPDNFIGNMKALTDPLASVTPDYKPAIDALEAPVQEKIDKIIEQSEKEIDQKIIRKAKRAKKKDIQDETIAVKEAPELQTFEEIYKKYNQHISPDELEVFVWWKSHTGKPLSRRWINLVKPGTYSEDSLFIPTPEFYNVPDEKIRQWVMQGLLYYYNGDYEPEFIYLSGNVYDKKDQLAIDKETIIEKFGQQVYENQLAAFNKAFKRKEDSKLTITGNNDDGLTLIPISKFAETFEISRIEMMAEDAVFKIKKIERQDGYGKPDLEKDPEIYSDYKKTEFPKLSLKYAFGYWLNKGEPQFKESISAMDVIKFYLLGKQIRNTINKENDPVGYEAEKARIEKLKASCQREGQRLFLQFLNEQLIPEDKERLENEWNGQFNNYLPIDYMRVPVAFTMCKYYKGKPEGLRPEKREAVASAFIEGSLCLSYDVGVGKTPSAIFTISAFLDAGYCLRPFICVPNQVYKQFISEIKAFTPHIPVVEGYNLSEEYIENFKDAKGNISKVPAGTITVITYEGLEQIGFNDQTYNSLFAELYEILNQGGEDERAKTQKQKESFQQKLESILGKGLRGTLFNIEDFGFDFGCYDEAHKMKKVFTAVKGEVEEDSETGKKERGRNPYAINSGTPSAIGLKGFMLNYYIQKNSGWQNVLLLTATPFTNSPLEIFSVLSMIAYNKLRQTDLNNIKSFFDTYVSTSTELVINSKLQPQFKQVILGFNNLLSLQTLIRRFINFKTGDQANVIRPQKYVLPYLKKLENGTVINLDPRERIETYIQMTPAQKAMMDDIVAYVEGKISLSELSMSNADAGDESEEEGSDKTEGMVVDMEALDEDEKKGVRTIRGITFSRNLALSPYLYEYSGMKNPSYLKYIDTSPKLKYVMECIRTVKEWHEKRKEPVSGQVIYMDRGIQYFGLIKEYLVKELGYQPHEVGIIKSGLPKNGKNSKEYIKNLFNGEIYNESTKLFDAVSDDERIKVVIGSSTIKEGINLQKYSTVLYNCFIDWNPTDIQQVEGRVWRQGNTFASVRIVNPLVTDSADIFLFQKLQEKTARLNSIWATDGRKNVLNTEEFNPEELKHALIRDPKVVAELRSIDEGARVQEQILGEQRLITNAQKVKQVVGTINYRLDDAAKLVEKFRDFSPSSSKIDDAEKLVRLVQDIDKKGTDKQGRVMYDEYDARELKQKNKWDDKKMVVVNWHDQFTKPYWFSDFSQAVRDFKKLYSAFLLPNKINVKLENTSDLDDFIKMVEGRISEMEEFKKKLDSDEYRDMLTKEVIAEREAQKIEYKTLPQSVKDFTRLNYLLADKKVDAVKQLSSVCPPMIGDERLTDAESLAQLEQCVLQQTETKALHVDENGIYKPERVALHKKIVDDLFKNVHCIRNAKPLAIFTGGAPGSGKSTYLKTIPWLMDKQGNINPNIFHIDADAIREKLPEYTGWNASATHKETQDIVKDVLNKLGEANCRYDFIYDGTMNRADKYFELINKVKKLGYETYIIFMNVPYQVSLQRTIDRYKKRGRYVPKEVIDDFFTQLPAPANKIKGLYALDQLKEVVDGYVVVDGVTGKITEQKGIDLPKQRYYKKEQVFYIPKAEEKMKKEAGSPGSKKSDIKSQINALKIAAKYAPDKKEIKEQISALEIALKYAA